MVRRSRILPALAKSSLAFVAVALNLNTASAQNIVNGPAFTLVSVSPVAAQFGLAETPSGLILIGNNSNGSPGWPIQVFDPSLYINSPIITSSLGSPVQDADGLAVNGAFAYVADAAAGVQKVQLSNGNTNLFTTGAGQNGAGDPIAIRASDGHVFVGQGMSFPTIQEFDVNGNLVFVHTPTAAAETMCYDAKRKLLFYADYNNIVRSYDPVTFVDTFVANVATTIDGGLSVDPWSGLILVGTVPQVPGAGLVQTINPMNGVVTTLAQGFDDIHGVVRAVATGDLYVLTDTELWRVKGPGVGPVSYCTAKINSLGCSPLMTMANTPSKSSSSGCAVTCVNVLGNKNGFFIHSIGSTAAIPFHNGFLCVHLPLKRHAVQNSGGISGTCTGTFFEDLDTYMFNGNDPNLVAGVGISMQTWSRDPNDPFKDSLSNGVFAIIAP